MDHCLFSRARCSTSSLFEGLGRTEYCLTSVWKKSQSRPSRGAHETRPRPCPQGFGRGQGRLLEPRPKSQPYVKYPNLRQTKISGRPQRHGLGTQRQTWKLWCNLVTQLPESFWFRRKCFGVCCFCKDISFCRWLFQTSQKVFTG